MSIFRKRKVAPSSRADSPDYFFIDEISPLITDNQAARLSTFAQAMTKANQSPVVLSGGMDPRADQYFDVYREKGHFFQPEAIHRNFFLELHGQSQSREAQMTALPIAGQLGTLKADEDYAHNSTLYLNQANQIVYRVNRAEDDSLVGISYFSENELVRTDSYDLHHRLFMTEYFGAVRSAVLLRGDQEIERDKALAARQLFDEAGRLKYAETADAEAHWLLDDHAVPVRQFDTQAALMAWWLLNNLDGTNRLYIDTSDKIFTQLISYPKLRQYIVPVVHIELKPAAIANMHFPALYVNETLSTVHNYEQFADSVTLMTNWHNFKKDHSWSVYTKY